MGHRGRGPVGHPRRAGEKKFARLSPSPDWTRSAALASLLVVLLATLLGSPRPVLAEPGAPAVIDSTTPVSLRAEPGVWSWAIGETYGGEAVTLLSGPTADGWYQVQRAEQVGWIHGWFLLIDGSLAWSTPPLVGPELPPVDTPLDPAVAAEVGVGGPIATSTAWVAAEGLSVYTAPDQWSGVLGFAAFGEPVTVTGNAINGFVPVSSWLGAGWVWSELLAYGPEPLAVGGPISEPPLAPAPAPEPGIAPPGPSAWPDPVGIVPAERWVDVNRSTQTVTLYEGGVPIAGYWAAMGHDQSADGFFATAVGSYRVYEKYRDLSWTVWGNAWVRDWVGFDPARANGFHSYSMDWMGIVLPDGAGPTNGCVALDPSASAAVFDFVAIGTRVEVHW